ncbi:hypothetical protein U9M48_025837 [Paspalum notatum var. saurae]|uniref:K Homology domain-containing protein n=1 Tax=Paspalum notatum var. saurae TaxID=547442 RepID=A0AAQ3WXJ2_PASNO
MAPPLEDEVSVGVQEEEEEEEEDPEEVEPWYPSSDSEPEPPTPPPALPSPEPEPKQVPPTPSLALPSPEPEPEQQQQPSPMTPPPAVVEKKGEGEEEPEAARHRWPGWPGTSVFRLVVPADKVGAVIGRRGEAVRRLCHETRARVRVLDAAAASRIVLVSATEEVESELPPAMNAAIKIFKHINKIEINSDGTLSASAPEICSVRLLVPYAQAAHLIGKQGITIKSIQESTGATIRIMDEDEVLSVESVDERIVDILGAPLKVHNALKSVLELLRKFLVDHGVLHLFERKIQGGAQPLDTSKENQVMDDYPLSVNRDFLSEPQSHGNLIDSRPLYGYDPSFCDPYSSDVIHATDSLTQQSHGSPEGSSSLCGRDPSSRNLYSPDLSQSSDSSLIIKTMQIPFAYAEEIIGVSGRNIELIRSVSGAIVVLEEIGDCLEEVLVTIKGSHSQVQTAHQLVQEVLSSGHNKEPPSRRSCWNVDAGTSLLNSPCAGPRLLHHPPRVIATSRDYPPWHHEDQPPRDHWRHPSHQGHRGYLP